MYLLNSLHSSMSCYLPPIGLLFYISISIHLCPTPLGRYPLWVSFCHLFFLPFPPLHCQSSYFIMPINYPKLLVLVLHLQWYHCFGFLHHSSSCGGFVGISRADTSSALQQTSSTSYLISNIVASSPELGGDIIRTRTGPDDDEDSFLSRVGT